MRETALYAVLLLTIAVAIRSLRRIVSIELGETVWRSKVAVVRGTTKGRAIHDGVRRGFWRDRGHWKRVQVRGTLSPSSKPLKLRRGLVLNGESQWTISGRFGSREVNLGGTIGTAPSNWPRRLCLVSSVRLIHSGTNWDIQRGRHLSTQGAGSRAHADRQRETGKSRRPTGFYYLFHQLGTSKVRAALPCGRHITSAFLDNLLSNPFPVTLVQ